MLYCKISNLIVNSRKLYTYKSQINSSNFSHHRLDKFINMKGVVINANELKHEFRDNNSSLIMLGKKLQRKLRTNQRNKSIIFENFENKKKTAWGLPLGPPRRFFSFFYYFFMIFFDFY